MPVKVKAKHEVNTRSTDNSCDDLMRRVSLKRKIASLADRPGGRSLLAALTTRAARHMTGDLGISIMYDDMWVDVVDGKFIPRSPRYNYYAFDLERIRSRAESRLTGSLDYWTYLYNPQPGDTIIDVGAGVGVDALSLAPLVGNTGRIYAIEANPQTYRALKKTISLNKLGNASPYNFAVADAVGEVWITNLENDEENSISKLAGEKSTRVPALDLDTFVEDNRIQSIDLLKMNIEGAEELAILGMSKSVDRIKNIAIACHDFRGDLPGTKGPVVDFLKKNGFQIEVRDSDSRSYVRDHVHGQRFT